MLSDPPIPGSMTPATVARYLLLALRQSLSGKLTKADRAALAQIADEAEVILSRRPGRQFGWGIDAAEVAALRAEGLSFSQIGKRLGVTKQAAAAALKRAQRDG